MDLRTPVSRERHVGAAWLFGLALLLTAGCNRPAEHVPEVQGKKPVAAEPAPPKSDEKKNEKPVGFGIESATADPYTGELALNLVFNQPVVGTQAFNTLIVVTGPKGEAIKGSWALDEDG